MANETASPRTSAVTSTTGTTRSAVTAESDDGALMAGLLQKDQSAWREFKRRFDPFLRFEVRKTIGWALREALPSDAIEDVLGDFYLSIVEEDMKKLRGWADGPRKAQLPSWLRMMVNQIAIDHVRAAFRRVSQRADLRSDVSAGVSDENWGEAWVDVQEVAEQREQDAAREAEREAKRLAKEAARKKSARAKKAKARRAKTRESK